MVIEELKKIRDCVWEIPSDYKTGMRVPGRIYLDDEAITEVEKGDLLSCKCCMSSRHSKVFNRTSRYSLWIRV